MKVSALLKKYTMVIALVVVFVFFTVLTGGKMVAAQNISNLLLQNAYVLIMACGMLLCILTGGNIDLSVGSVVCFVGGIGAVMGHEISHAFDSNGAKCDEKGNLNNWWKKEDFKAFKARTKAMVKEFDGFELPWGKVNGSFTVSENIADNGGMAVTLDLMKKTKNASYEEYFIQWAKVWSTKANPEYLQLLLTIDEHSPAMVRANMPPRNFEEWYKAFNVTNKDKMYLSPNKRVVIW